MTARQLPIVPALLGIIAVIAGVATLGGSDDRYRVDVLLSSANGLRDGAPVESGGVQIGTIKKLRIGAGDQVVAEVRIDDGRGPIGAGSGAAIKAKNLLGEKFLVIDRGDIAHPQPSGVKVPSARVTESVDLDQVLDVLDTPTRARLGILISEAGGAVAGRRVQLNEILRQLPPSFSDATRLVDQVVNDNHTLGQLIERSDRFVKTLAAQRQPLGALVGTAGQAAHTVAARRADLDATLARTPATLASLRRFLADLQATTIPLGPAARAISATAPPLHDTVAQVTPFQRAAQPTLDEATQVAPRLTALGRKATPILRKADPTIASLTKLATAFQPVSRTLDVTVDDLLAVLQGWSRAIQTRDGLTHMFRAKVHFNADSVRTLLTRLAAQIDARKAKQRPAAKAPGAKPSLELPSVPVGEAAKPGGPKLPVVSKVPVVGPAVEKVTNGVDQLLDYLLGR